MSSTKAIKYKCVTLALLKLGLEKDYEYRHCQEVDKLSSRKNGDIIDFPKGIKCVKDYGKITFFKEKELQQNTAVKFKVGDIVYNEKIVSVSQKTTDKFLKFDISKLPTDCIIRSRQEGDVFTPFNGKNKKLKKYLIDKKIPCRKRDELLLVAKDNQVYIIIGIEIADSIKVDKNAGSVYYIGIKN